MNPLLEVIATRVDLTKTLPEPAGIRAILRTALLALFALALCWSVWGYHAGFHALNSGGRLVPHAVLQSLTYMGDTLFGLTMVLIFARRYPQILWTAVVSALIALLLSRGLKELLEFSRPALVLEPGSFHLEGPRYRLHSFPSGHSVTAFVMAGVFVSYLPTALARAMAFSVAFLIAGSRILVGAHWPADVLAGAVVGCVSVLAGLRIVRSWSWGLRLEGHLILVGLLILSAACMLVLPLPYPKAEPMARTVALLALSIAAWNYGLAPRLMLDLRAWGRRILEASVPDNPD